MAKTIATLNIHVGASAAAAKAELASVGGAAQRLKAQISGVSGTMAGTGAASGAAAASLARFAASMAKVIAAGAALGVVLGAVQLAMRGITSFIAGVFEQFEKIDKQAKTADLLGITTEALGQLQHAAEMAGVQADQMSKSLQGLGRRVSEAASGMGEAKDVLRELGLDAQKLNQLTVDKQFIAVAAAMQEVTNKNDQLRIATKLFEDEGAALVNVLKDGTRGLADMAAEAHRLGILISREQAEKIVEANKAVKRMTAAWDGFKQELAIAVAPAVESLIDLLTELLLAIRPVIDAVGVLADAFNEWFFDTSGLEAQSKAAKELEKEYRKIADSVKLTADVGAELNVDTSKLAETMQAEQERLQDLGKQITDEFRTPVEVYADRIQELFKVLEAGAINMETFHRATAGAVDELLSAEQAMKRMADPLPFVAAAEVGTVAGFTAIQEGMARLQQMRSQMQETNAGGQRRDELLQSIDMTLRLILQDQKHKQPIKVNKVRF